MIRLTELRLPLDHAEPALRAGVVARLGVPDADLCSFSVFRRAVDARRKSAVMLTYTVDCDVRDEAAVLSARQGDPHVKPAPDTTYRFIGHAPADFDARGRPRPIVIGFGPCGIFAALVLAQMGLRPIVLERGKRVRERTKDTWGLWRKGVLNPESNVQFGEGGAGTFSDGKLWSQISDPRHLTRKVLTEFVKAGAPEEILYVAKPHIGTFRLVSMVEKMRAEIESLGGEVRFEQRVVDVMIEAGAIRGVTVANPAHPEGETLDADHVVLAPGHSARDTFAMLYERGVFMEAKPFSVGFRVEHPQGVIDRARYGASAGHPILGAADYKLVHHAKNGRSVYSFCMCPGGTVVAATSETGRVVTNGMSQYSRAERNANAGIVVGIAPADYAQAGHVDDRHRSRRASARRHRVPAAMGVTRVRTRWGRLLRAGAARGRFPEGAAVERAGRGAAVLHTRCAADRSWRARSAEPARVCARCDPRGDPGVRPPDQGFRATGRRVHGCRDAHLVAAAHHARRRHAERQRQGSLSSRRGRGLCGRHHVGRSGRH